MKKRIYLDYAAGAPMKPKARKALDYFSGHQFGNPSSICQEGRTAHAVLEETRKKILTKIFKTDSGEIIFTGGGTESINLAILGVARQNKNIFSRPRIISSTIEHPAVLEVLKWLGKEGFDIKLCGVDKFGIINLRELKKLINKETLLVSIMHANNEIGVVQPVKEIAEIINKRKTKSSVFPIFHTDACQSAGYLDISPQTIGADLITINSSKIGGPKGIGALFKKKSIDLQPLIFGGGQENGLRSGTENFSGIMSFSEALLSANASKNSESIRLKKLRDNLIKRITKEIPGTFLNGHPQNRLPNNTHFTILGIEGESLVLILDRAGFSTSTGSACHSKSLLPSHVLSAIGLPKEVIHGSLRVTIGSTTTEKEIESFIKELKKAVTQLRSFSAVNWQDLAKKLNK